MPFFNIWQVIIEQVMVFAERALRQHICEGLKPALQPPTIHLTISSEQAEKDFNVS